MRSFTVSLPAVYDVEKSDIMLYIDTNNGNYVMLNCEKNCHLDFLEEERLVGDLWKEKYNRDLPPTVDVYAPESTLAWAIRKDNDLLSDEEWEWCYELSENYHTQLTVADIWNVVAGLGWKLGVPVPADHPGWQWLENRYSDDDLETSMLFIKRALRMEGCG